VVSYPSILPTNSTLPLISPGRNFSVFFLLPESSPQIAAPSSSGSPRMTLKAPTHSLASPKGSMLLFNDPSRRSSARKPFCEIGSSPSMKSCASRKGTTNFSSKTAIGAWNSWPAKAAWTGSLRPSRVRPPNSSQKVQVPAFAPVRYLSHPPPALVLDVPLRQSP
jgi:hypothetical protein